MFRRTKTPSTREVQRQNYRNNLPPSAWFEQEAARILAMIGDYEVAEFGGKKFASNFRSIVEQTLSKAAARSEAIVQKAADELAAEMGTQAQAAARLLRQEAQHVRDSFNEYTGNAEPEEVQGEAEPPPATSQAPVLETAQATPAASPTPLPAVMVDQIIPTEPPRTMAPGMPTWASDPT